MSAKLMKHDEPGVHPDMKARERPRAAARVVSLSVLVPVYNERHLVAAA